MDFGLLPDSVKSKILSHVLQPRAPAAQRPSEGQSRGGTPPRLRGKSITHGPLVLDGFLPPKDAEMALAEAIRLVEEKAGAARMGGAAVDAKWANSKFRGDVIVWLHPDKLSAGAHPALSSFLSCLASQLQPWLQRQGYDVRGRPTFQLGYYPAGARYVRHRDAGLTAAHRTVTALCYLNTGWKSGDGGELCIYHLETSPPEPTPERALGEPIGGATAGEANPAWAAALEPGSLLGRGSRATAAEAGGALMSGLEEGHAATVVPPVGGRLVVFDSRTEHEVLVSHAPRYAVAAWFTRGEEGEEGRRSVGQQLGREPSNAEQGHQLGAGRQEPPEEEQSGAAAEAAAATAAAMLHGLPQRAQQAEHHLQEPEQPAPHPAPSGDRVTDAAGTAGPPPCAAPALCQDVITSPQHIFVSIASYRDSETQWTLLDLFEKAERPDLIRAGVVWQVDWERDRHFVGIAPGGGARLRQVRQVIVDCTEATGPCKARAMAQQLWDGEEFYLQIDSHMRFAHGWDSQLLRMLWQAEEQAQHGRVVLSTYPPGYEGEGQEAQLPVEPPTTLLCASHFGAEGMLRLKGRQLREAPPGPLPALFWAAGLSFSRAQLLLEAPYDRNLPFLFFGEELLQLVSMWRRGWDVFAPSVAVVFHLWSRAHRPSYLEGASIGGAGAGAGAKDDGGGTAPAPPLAALRLESQQRVQQVLGQVQGEGAPAATAAAAALFAEAEQEPSWWRSLEQFYQHCGVDFGKRVILERGKWGGRSQGEFSPSLQDLLVHHAQQA